MATDETKAIDDVLMLNRVLDRYGEMMREGMSPGVVEKFDALSVADRRSLIIRAINSAADREGK